MHVALRSHRKEKRRWETCCKIPDLLLEVQEVVGLVDEKDLQSRAPEVVPAQVNLSDLRQRPFKVLTYTWKHRTSVSSLSSYTWPSHCWYTAVPVSPHLPLSLRCCRRSRCVVWWAPDDPDKHQPPWPAHSPLRSPASPSDPPLQNQPLQNNVYKMCVYMHNFFFKEINTFIQRRCIKLIKSGSKDIYNAVISSNFLFIEGILKINHSLHRKKKFNTVCFLSLIVT